MNRWTFLWAVSLGLAVYLGLGAFGVGTNTAAHALALAGVSTGADGLSRAIVGVLVCAATMAFVHGYDLDKNGRITALDRSSN